MKRILYYIFQAFVLASLVWSCSYLDRDTGDTLSESELFSRMATAEGYLSNAYSFLPDFTCCTEDNAGRYNIGCATDELGYQQIEYGNASPYGINNGGWGPSAMPLQKTWTEYYQCIRRCNVFLDNYDRIPEEITTSGVDKKLRLKGEALALRGYYHWLLFRQWGGIPVMRNRIEPGNLDAIANIARSSAQETVEAILEDLNASLDYLPVKHDDINYGRMTSVAVRAIISQVLLYWASPLWNPEGSSDYKDRWKEAASAASSALQNALSNGYVLAPRYSDLFGNVAINEYILTKNSPLTECFYWDYYHFPAGYGGISSVEGVLQEMVDAFEMNKSGQLPVLGYNEDGTQIVNPKATDYNTNKPWVGRDPRFYYAIMCHGDALQGGYIDTSEGSEARNASNPTFYYIKKYTDTKHNLLKNFADYSFTYRRFALIRTSELYLNVAEALNETEGPSARVIEYVNTIRRRAGCETEIKAGITKDEMRERIRRERRMELCFEGHRFYDVRRWDIASTVDNGPVHRVEVEVERDANSEKILDKNGNTIITKISYPVYQNRVFKANLFPIPQSEIDKNSKLEQNPEWNNAL